MVNQVWKFVAIILLLNFCRTDDGPSIIGISRNKVLNIGGTLELECQVENSENFLVIWTKFKKRDQPIPITVGSRLVYPDPRFNLTVNNNTQTYKIKIENLEPNDSAKYECKIKVVGGGTERNKQSVDVIIQEPPQITLKTTNWTTLELGNSENLFCAANGVPKPQIKWHREDGKMLPFGGHTHDGNSLRLQNVTKDDRGIYICAADNGAGTPDRRSIQVKVIFPPHVTTEFPKMGQALRNSVKLSCVAEGFPYVVFDLKHNGVILRDDDNYLREFNYYLSDIRHTNLTIGSLKETQYGDYYCEASNILGVVAKRIHVFQTKAPVKYK